MSRLRFLSFFVLMLVQRAAVADRLLLERRTQKTTVNKQKMMSPKSSKAHKAPKAPSAKKMTMTKPSLPTAPSPVAPSPVAPPSPPTVVEGIPAPVADYYIAYNASTLTTDLTASQYAALLQETTSYFNQVFLDTWANNATVQYLYSDFTINKKLFGAGIPAARFNLYVNYNTTLVFDLGSVIPTPDELFSIMARAITGDPGVNYIINYVRMVPGLDGVVEIVFRAVEMAAPVSG